MQGCVLTSDREGPISYSAAQFLVGALALYGLVGLAFAAPFAWRGAGALDPAAKEGTWGFRLLIVPGAAALWPLLLAKWRRAARDGGP